MVKLVDEDPTVEYKRQNNPSIGMGHFSTAMHTVFVSDNAPKQYRSIHMLIFSKGRKRRERILHT